ncbi:MAG: metallopeptidase family protein [bacterium]
MKNVDVLVEDLASRDLLSGIGLQFPFQLLGLYQGVPLDRRGFYYGNVLRDKIALFQIPIESVCQTQEMIKEKTRLQLRTKREAISRSSQRILYLRDFRGFILETIP